MSFFTLISFISGKVSDNLMYSRDRNGNEYPEFLIGCFDNGFDISYENTTALNFNLWHQYTDFDFVKLDSFKVKGWDWYNDPSIDQLYYPVELYAPVVKNRLDLNSQYGMKTILMRPKLRWLTAGQRSDYQCEPVSTVEDLWFYAFNVHETGKNINDDGKNVMFCNKGSDRKGYVVQSLRANSEQVSVNGSRFEGDNLFRWYIKPSIRIPVSVALNEPSTPVCKVNLYDYDGKVFRSVEIKAENFIDPGSGSYDGSYIEEFFFNDGNHFEINPLPDPVSKNAFNPGNKEWAFTARGTDRIGNKCKMDIRIEWLGLCDMWIDYVRVDNEVADKLFKGYFDSWLIGEAELAAYNSSPFRTYVDEFEFNNIPCMKYVNDTIYKFSGNKITMLCDLNVGLYNAHLPSITMGADHVKRNLVDRMGLKDVFMGPYPFDGNSNSNKNFSKIPNSLLITTGEWVLGTPVPPGEYENWLQNKLDGSNIWSVNSYMKFADELSKSSDIPYLAVVQSHVWYGGSSDNAHRLREPTNEEQQMLVNISISYGAKGLMYFWYDGFYSTPDFWAFGLTDDSNNKNFSKRGINFYGQPKWNNLININSKAAKWGPYLVSFDNLNRKTYRYHIPAERNNMSSSTCINSLKTVIPVGYPVDALSSPDISDMNSDPANESFISAAFFNKFDGNNGDYYFMVVNRRCSPYINSIDKNSNGGRRIIAFEPNVTFLRSAPVWKIVDLATGKTVVKFSLGNDTNVILGDFMPGEGKLYKLTSTPD